MAEKIGGLTVELSGEAKGLIDAARKSASEIGKLIPSFKSMAGAVALGNAAWAAASQAMGMAKAATVDLVSASMQFIDANNDIAAKTGISTASLGMLEYAARMNGTEFETLTKSVGKMLKAVGEVQSGNDGAGKSFEALGISLEQVKSLSTEDLLGTVADQIQALPTTAMQAAAAMSIFGKSGADLLPLLQGGSAGIAQMTQEAGDLGLMIGSIDSAKVGQANDAIDKMKMLFKGVGNVLAVEISPMIEKAISDTIEWSQSGAGLRENVGGALEYILEGAAKIGDFTMTLQEGFHRVAAIVESAFALIPMGLEKAMDGVIATVNGAISAMNMLPGVDIGLIEPREEAFAASTKILDNAKEHIAKAEELAAQQGKYGESVKGWIEGARDAAQATAETNAAQSTGSLPVAEETLKPDTMKKSVDAIKEYGDSTKTAASGVNEMAQALGNLGSASEVDLGALTGGASIVGGGGLNTISGFSDTGATFGGRSAGGETMGGHAPQLDRIAMFLEMLVALGKQPSTVEFGGGLTSEYST